MRERRPAFVRGHDGVSMCVSCGNTFVLYEFAGCYASPQANAPCRTFMQTGLARSSLLLSLSGGRPRTMKYVRGRVHLPALGCIITFPAAIKLPREWSRASLGFSRGVLCAVSSLDGVSASRRTVTNADDGFNMQS